MSPTSPTSPTGAAALRTSGLSKHFSGFRAVNAVDLTFTEGVTHALVGPNGAGKTTLFNLLTGALVPSAGDILLHGQDVTGLRPDQTSRMGLARSFQITSLFDQVSVREHVELALQSRTHLGYRFWRSERLLDRHRTRALELLDEMGLVQLADVPAGSLAYGQKRALDITLALALSPSVLLLDEPTAGMGLEDVERTVEMVRRAAAGRTVVIVEHNMKVVASLAQRVTVLQQGSVLVEGTYDEVRQDPRVVSAYLGEPVA